MGIRQWLIQRDTKKKRVESENFLSVVRSADREQVDAVSAAAIFYASVYLDEGIDLYRLSDLADEKEKMVVSARLLGALHREQAHGNKGGALGLMVWMHTVRAMYIPEILPSVRELWRILNSASDGAMEVASEISQAADHGSTKFDPSKTPVGI